MTNKELGAYYNELAIKKESDAKHLAEWNSWPDASSWEPIGEALYLDDVINLIKHDMEFGTESADKIYSLLMAGVRDYIATVIYSKSGGR